MTLQEVENSINLEPEYLEIIYNNGFEISKYKAYNIKDERKGIRHVQRITIPIKILGKTYKLKVYWDDCYEAFSQGFLAAVDKFSVAKIIREEIIADKDISYSGLEHMVEKGRETLDILNSMRDEIFSMGETLWQQERENREQADKEERLSRLSLKEREHILLEEKVFDELAESLIFKKKRDRAYFQIHDINYEQEFENWVINEVNWRVSLIEERGT